MNPSDHARQHAFQETLLSARRTMVLSEVLRLALDSFRVSKLRFALTALGMVIGTASVILVVTIGMTGKQYILEQLQKIETNSVELEYVGGGALAAEQVLYNDYLTRADEKAVLSQLPGVLLFLSHSRDARPHQLWRRGGEGYFGAGGKPAISEHS